jgi:putative peptidoglycan lipid II flippase
MYKNLLSVGAFTLLSRATGFLRDVMLGAVLGAGLLADAFYIAFRLPNHFRAIFGEGAFNAAYVPSYSRVLETEGPGEARHFSSQIFTLLLLSQIVLLALAWAFTPQLLALLAPGVEADPQKFEAALTMTRITFPYLLCITLVTLHSGTLNANGRFAAAAFAPVLLNVVMMAFLALAFVFPDAGIAAAAGITASGLAQLAVVMWAARKSGVLEGLARPRWSGDVRQFFRALGPAVIGSAGVQIALFADTIIASLLPTGAISSIYYADRIYQLPIGVIGIAAGTVLLPEMSRRLAAGDPGAAFHAQNRTMALTIALSAPFFVAFLIIPDLIMRGVFLRGRFTVEAATASANVLAAYGLGLFAVVLIASARASFQARGDTRTPMYVSLAAVGVNVVLKLALYQPLGAVGLATATAVGAWINFGLLVILAVRARAMRGDRVLARVCAATLAASLLLAGATVFLRGRIEHFTAELPTLHDETALLLLGALGAIIYGTVLFFGLRVLGVRLGTLARRRASKAPVPPLP